MVGRSGPCGASGKERRECFDILVLAYVKLVSDVWQEVVLETPDISAREKSKGAVRDVKVGRKGTLQFFGRES